MKLRHLEVVEAIARSRTMRDAAVYLGVSQSALSQTLKHAEATLGYALFLREGRRLVPTAELRALLPKIDRLFADLRAVRQQSMLLGRRGDETLAIAAIPALINDRLARATAEFRRAYPRLAMSVQSMLPDMVTASVSSGSVSIGLMHGPVHANGLTALTIGTNVLVAVMADDDALAEKECVSPRDLTHSNLIMFSEGSILTKLTESAFRAHNVPVPSILRMTTATSALTFVRRGIGVALIDSLTAETFRFEGVSVRRFSPAIRLDICAIVSTDRPLSLQARDFVAKLVAHRSTEARKSR